MDTESDVNHGSSGQDKKNHVCRYLGNIYFKLIKKNCDLIETNDGFTD